MPRKIFYIHYIVLVLNLWDPISWMSKLRLRKKQLINWGYLSQITQLVWEKPGTQLQICLLWILYFTYYWREVFIIFAFAQYPSVWPPTLLKMKKEKNKKVIPNTCIEWPELKKLSYPLRRSQKKLWTLTLGLRSRNLCCRSTHQLCFLVFPVSFIAKPKHQPIHNASRLLTLLSL